MKEKAIYFSIDRLSLIGEFKHLDFFYQIRSYLVRYDETNLLRTNTDFFEVSFTLEGLGLIQLDKYSNKIRIEFNPNNITIEGKKHFNYILSMIKNIHYTRLDLAIDLFNYDISSYNIVDIGTRKSAYFYDKLGKLETIYSGSMKSSKYIRIYNKAREQKLNDEIDWWRFEIQLRDVYINKYFTDLLEFYKDILIFKYTPIQQYSTEENAMLEYLLHDFSRIEKIGKNQRTKYRKIIRELKISSLDFLDDIISLTSAKVIDWLNYITDNNLYPEIDIKLLNSDCSSYITSDVGGSYKKPR